MEVDSAGQVVWTYNAGGQIGRAMEYPRDFLTGIREKENGLHSSVAGLELNSMPNPWNNATTLRYYLPISGRDQLAIYDIAGKIVCMLIDDEKRVGPDEVLFQPKSRNDIPAGIYFARLSISTRSGISRVTTLRLVGIQ